MSLEVIDDAKDPHPDDQSAFRMPDNSAYGRMLRKWNKPKRDGGFNADGFEKFPMMLHRARETQAGSGKWILSKPEPEYIGFRNEAEYDAALKQVKKFNESCQHIVQNEQEYERMRGNGEGWCDTPRQAMDWRESLESEIGKAALETEVASRKMSSAAQREARDIIDGTTDHVPEITRTPVRKPGKRPAA